MPALPTVQRFVHNHVAGCLGRSDLSVLRSKMKDMAFTDQEEEARAFTLTWRTDGEGQPLWYAVRFGSDTDLRFLTLYFHVVKKVHEKTCSLTPCVAAFVMTDIHDLHFAVSEVEFHGKLVGALIDQVLKLCQSELVRARSFAVDPSPEVRLVRCAKAMQREGLLLERPAAGTSIAFLLEGEISDDEIDVVRVTGQPCARVFDEVLQTTAENMPISAQLTRLAAEMERRGMPTNGWAVNVVSRALGTPCGDRPKRAAHLLSEEDPPSETAKNGKVLYLTDWEPTLEPISNLSIAEVRKFQKKRRRLTEKARIETEAASNS
ncbi:hypothetical protein BBJ28_00013246 [Nothophytophthora sp. Chile5]|nr:hypothetical protein BBJ28_00013246 [Nothophytophthora sp. Chile5]